MSRRGRRNPWLWIQTAVITLIALITVSCGGSDDSSGSGTGGEGEGGLVEVELLAPFPPSILRPGLIMAQDRYFEEEGLDVTVTTVDGSSVVLQQLIAENASMGLLDTANILIANSKGQDSRAISNFNYDVFGIVVPDDSEIDSIDDLEGETIGVTDLAGGEVTLIRSVLSEYGLELDTDVKAVAIGEGGPASFDAISRGRVAAFGGVINDFVALELEGLTLRSIVPDEYTNLPAGNFVTLGSALEDEESESVAARLVRAHAKGLLFASANLDAALEIGCEVLPEECQDQEVARAIMERGLESSLPVSGGPFENNIEAWQITAELLVADLLEGPVDIEEIASNSLSDEINNIDVDQIEQDAGSE